MVVLRQIITKFCRHLVITFTIFDEGNAFRLQAPKGVLTPQLLEVFTSYQADLLYLVRMGDVRVCPERSEHRPHWSYSATSRMFVCRACRHEEAA